MRGQRSEVRGQGSESIIANLKLQIANCKLRAEELGARGERLEKNSSFNIHHSSLRTNLPIFQSSNHRSEVRGQGSGFRVQGSENPSSFIIHHSSFPSGLSLIEVLVAVFVLSLGLLGIAALIPLGHMALWETAKADRSGACGRAAMREIEVQRMLDYRYWHLTGTKWGESPPGTPIANDYTNVSSTTNFDSMPFIVDPLGRSDKNNLSEYFGRPNPTSPLYLHRRSLTSLPLALNSPPQPPVKITDTLAEQTFFWSDDLLFDTTKNSTERPRMTTSASATIVSEGSYSWFFSVVPAATEMSMPVKGRRLFNVSVVVCYKRAFQTFDSTQPVSAANSLDGEHTAYINSQNVAAPKTTGFPGMGIGGGTVQLDANSNVNVKANQWVMLYHLHFDASNKPVPQLNRCNWYRVLSVGKDATSTTSLTLSGPDWDPNLDAILVVVPGAIGVYTTTMELDWDPLWTK